MSDREPSFFPVPKAIKLHDLVETLECSCPYPSALDASVVGLAPLAYAEEGDLTFIDNPKYLDALANTRASACICAPKYSGRVPKGVAVLEAKDPYRTFAQAAALLYPAAMKPSSALPEGTRSPQAYIADSAEIEDAVTIEPFAYIGDHAKIGAGTYIASGVRIGDNVTIGRGCAIDANAVLQHAFLGDRVIIHPGVKIGQDGYGFALSPMGHLKVPQVGRVIVQDDVEIGANTTIDRGANRDTIIGEGTKIDNQVQIGHNVIVGRHCIIVSQVGISGSATLEDFVAIGGQTGVNGHVTIGMGAQIAAVSVVHGDVPSGARWGGVPARPVREWFKEQQLLKRLVRQKKDDGQRTNPSSLKDETK